MPVIGKGVNLLDNWYFVDPVNQRGEKEYKYAGVGYTFDRWRASEETKVKLTNNGVELSSDNKNSYLDQRVDWSIDDLIGKTLTLSVLLADAALLVGTGTINGTVSATTAVFPVVWGDNWAINLYQTASYIFPQLRVNTGYTKTFVAAKLELGTVQTLAHQENGRWVLNDPPPNKALELAKCQRFFQTFATQNLRPAKGADFRPVMRTDNPTLSTITTSGGTTLYTASSDL